MKKLFTTTLICCLGLFAFSQSESEHATITFLGGNFQKDAKLEIKFNGKTIGFLSKGLELKFTTFSFGEAIITTQGYNMIDAMYGPPVQIKFTIEPNQEIFFDGKWSKSQHLNQITKSEIEKATKGGKKIFSTVEVKE